VIVNQHEILANQKSILANQAKLDVCSPTSHHHANRNRSWPTEQAGKDACQPGGDHRQPESIQANQATIIANQQQILANQKQDPGSLMTELLMSQGQARGTPYLACASAHQRLQRLCRSYSPSASPAKHEFSSRKTVRTPFR